MSFVTIVLLLFAFLFLLAVAGLVVFLVIRSRRPPAPSLVNPMVRRALNEDLDRATTKAEVNRVKRQWLEDDGWELAE